jgi:hypothetical protein
VRTSIAVEFLFVFPKTVSPAGREASDTDDMSLPNVANFSGLPSIAYVPAPVFWIFCWINSVGLNLITRTYLCDEMDDVSWVQSVKNLTNALAGRERRGERFT